MNNRWTSRKWLLTILTEILGGATALGGFVYGEREVAYGGLAICVASLVAYLKAEKDVDVAWADAEAEKLWHANHCKDCKPEA